MLDFEDVKFDCFHFKGTIPCKPNKLYGVDCANCSYYEKIQKRILIIKLGALGDVIRSTPLLEKLRKTYPGSHITWLTLSPSILPPDKIDEILPLNFINLYTIENSDFDIAINLDKDKEACILLSNLNSKEKYGYLWSNGTIAPANAFAKHKLKTGFFDHISKANTKNYIEEIFEICGFEFQGEEYQINLNDALVVKWKNHFSTITNNKKIVGLNTGCGPRWNTRLWDEENWIETARLLANYGFFPVFLGGELEHDKNLRLAEKSEAFYPGHFSLPEFIALTNSCDFIVTQVTMMMHIATALRKKMVLMNTIFNPYEFELYGRGLIVGPEKACDCYFGNSCIHGDPCMQTIAPSKITDAIHNLSML